MSGDHIKKFVPHLRLRLMLIVSIVLLGSNAKAQQGAVPVPNLDSAALNDILEWLNTNAFPRARIGVKDRGQSHKGRFGLPDYYTGNAERIFSEGFHVTSVNGCQLILRNEPVAIIDATYSHGKFQKFIVEKNGERKLTPQVASLFLSLNRMSDRGKAPYLHTDDPDKAKLLGSWRTIFDNKGFILHEIFGMELTAAEQPHTKELAHFNYLTFTFDNKELAEQFNAAFRRAIKICGSK